MSIVNLFEEELEKRLKKIGLSMRDVKEYETESDESVVIYLTSGTTIRIHEPYLARLAKAKTNEEILVTTLSKDNLLKRLYALESIFKGAEDWREFLSKYSSLQPREILEKIKEIEERNKVDIPYLKEYLIAKISNLLTRKGTFYPQGIEAALDRLTTQELSEIYVKLAALPENARYNVVERFLSHIW